MLAVDVMNSRHIHRTLGTTCSMFVNAFTNTYTIYSVRWQTPLTIQSILTFAGYLVKLVPLLGFLKTVLTLPGTRRFDHSALICQYLFIITKQLLNRRSSYEMKALPSTSSAKRILNQKLRITNWLVV